MNTMPGQCRVPHDARKSALLLLPLCVLLSGCFSYHREHFDSAGQTLAQLRPGEHGSAWLLEHFGAPLLETVDGNTEIWRYETERLRHTNIRLLPVAAINIEKQKLERLAFEVHNGTVRRYWRETVQKESPKKARSTKASSKTAPAAAEPPHADTNPAARTEVTATAPAEAHPQQPSP